MGWPLALATLGSAGIGAYAGKKQAEKGAQDAFAYSARGMEMQQNYNLWNYMNRYQLTKKDMQAAGLNPIMAMSGGFNVSGQPTHSNNPGKGVVGEGAQAGALGARYADMFASTAKSFQDIEKTSQEVTKIEADTEKVFTDIENVVADTHLKKIGFQESAERIRKLIDEQFNIEQDTEVKKLTREKIHREIIMLRKKTKILSNVEHIARYIDQALAGLDTTLGMFGIDIPQGE